jgi:hypothetical protein
MVFCVGLIGCTEPNEFFGNDTYTVINYRNVPVDDYLQQSSLVLQYLEIDKNGEVNRIFINTWGECTAMGIHEEDAYFLPPFGSIFTGIIVNNIRISRDTLKGKISFTGPTIWPYPADFTAVRGIKNKIIYRNEV